MRLSRLLVTAAAVAAPLAFAVPASAGSAHFVGTPTYTLSGSTLTVSAKEAGLGDEAQINAVLTATAQCVNPGGNQPSAANKAGFTTSAKEPVQNGQSTYTISGTFAFQPSCSPPMTVQITSVTLTDTTNGISAVPVAG
jgi:hypothetical protein